MARHRDASAQGTVAAEAGASRDGSPPAEVVHAIGDEPEREAPEAAQPDGGATLAAEQSVQAILGEAFNADAIASWVERNLVFLLLLAVLAFARHAGAIVRLALLASSAAGSTMHLQALVAAPHERRLLKSLDVLAIVALNTWALTCLKLPDAALLRTLRLRAPRAPLTAGECLFQAAAGALLVKQWIVLPKVVAVFTCAAVARRAGAAAAAHRRQARLLTLLEYLSIFLVDATPVPIWFGFFLRSCGGASMLAAALAGTYVAVKGFTVATHARDAASLCRLTLLGLPSVGSRLSRAAVLEAGSQCPICQDAPRDALQLPCRHVFCDACISEWLERERTCPMCRSTIRGDSLRSFASGASSLLPPLF